MKKRMHSTANMMTVIIIVLLLTTYQQVLAQANYKVTANKLNVRATPSTSSTIIGTLTIGTIVNPIDVNMGWAKIKYKNKVGYVNTTYLKKEDTKAKTSTQIKVKDSTNERVMSKPLKTVPQKSPTYNNKSQRQPKWLFSLGAMPHRSYEEEFTDLSWMAMIGGDFPIATNGGNLSLETGLRYLHMSNSVMVTDYMYQSASFIEVPVLLCYDLQIADKLSLRLGAGPFISYLAEDGGGLMVGLEPKVALKYKNVGLGMHFSTPLYKGFDGEKKNFPMLTFNVTFGGKTWKYIATGLEAVGQVSQNVLDSGLLSSNQEQQTQRYDRPEKQQSVADENLSGNTKYTYEEEKRLTEINRLIIQKSQKGMMYNDNINYYSRIKASVKENEYRTKKKKIDAEIKDLNKEKSRIIDNAKKRQKTGITSPSQPDNIDNNNTNEQKDKQDDQKTKSENERNYRMGEGAKLVNWYNEDKRTILKVKDGDLKNWSISEKRKLVRDCQERMKKRREEYEKYAGKSITGGDRSLENWQPTDAELSK